MTSTRRRTTSTRSPSARVVAAPVPSTLLALALLAGAAPPAAAQPGPLEGLDEYVRRAMETWRVPGLALAVVRDDSVVYAAGYGVRELGREGAVDANTLFAIGSSSKAFTTASLAMLVDEEEVAWDDRVRRHLPWFRMHDGYVTRELTLRDLVTHRSGLPRCDGLWYGTSFDRDDILRRVRHCEPEWSFRSHFGYQNIMFLAAGRVVAETSGRRWDAFVEERIFEPLGMSRSNTSVDSLEDMENVAAPHAEGADTLRAVPWRDIDNVGPAGSINSSVRDMARWVRLQLGRGVFRGDTLIDPSSIAEMHRPQMLIERDGRWERLVPEGHFLAYGMGWFLHDYRGRKIVEHGGAIDGMRAQVAMMPEEDVGVVILTNRGGSSLGTPLMFRVFDAYLDAPARDWAARYRTVADSLQAEADAREEQLREARVDGTEPSLEPLDYAGAYANSLYGSLRVRHTDGGLVLEYDDALTADLVHWHFDTFRTEPRSEAMQGASLSQSLVTFRLDARGRVAGVRVPGMGRFDRVRASDDREDGGR